MSAADAVAPAEVPASTEAEGESKPAPEVTKADDAPAANANPTGGDAEVPTECTVFQNPEHYTIKHPLRHNWTLWYDIPVTKVSEKDWLSNLKQIYTFKTVEDFWGVYNNLVKASQLSQGGNFHLFKEGVKPMWEDPANKEGGKWQILLPNSQKQELDSMWLNTVLACIGEIFDNGDTEEICGCVCSPRRYKNKLALWTRTGDNATAQQAIGKKWKEICEYDQPVGYQKHNGSGDLYKV